jgi:hypothetical protein
MMWARGAPLLTTGHFLVNTPLDVRQEEKTVAFVEFHYRVYSGFGAPSKGNVFCCKPVLTATAGHGHWVW